LFNPLKGEELVDLSEVWQALETLRATDPDNNTFHWACLTGESVDGQPPKEIIVICFDKSYSMDSKAQFPDMQRYYNDPKGKVLLSRVCFMLLMFLTFSVRSSEGTLRSLR